MLEELSRAACMTVSSPIESSTRLIDTVQGWEHSTRQSVGRCLINVASWAAFMDDWTSPQQKKLAILASVHEIWSRVFDKHLPS